MKKAIYENMYDLFKKVGRRHNFDFIVNDEDYCRDVFHSRIHTIMHHEDLVDISKENTNISNEYRFPHGLRNHLYTAFKWAYLDEVKSANFKRSHPNQETENDAKDVIDQDEPKLFLSKEGFVLFYREKPSINYEAIDQKLRDAAEKILLKLEREKWKLISLRFVGGNTLSDCSKVLGMRIQKLDRKVKSILREIRASITAILGEVQHTEARQIWECLIMKLFEWKEAGYE